MQNKLYPQAQKKTNGNCPTCGFHISHSSSFDGVLAGQFDNKREGSYVATRITPVRASTFQSDVAVPAAQSLVWAVVSALPAIPVSYALRYEWYFPVVVSSVALLASWVSAMKRSDRAQAKIEEFSYYTNETESGKTEQRSAQVSVSLDVTDRSDENSLAMKFVELPPSVSVEKFNNFCGGVVAGTSLARSNWTPERKMFSRDQYDQLVAKLTSSGIIFEAENRVRTLTVGGRRAMARYLQMAQEE